MAHRRGASWRDEAAARLMAKTLSGVEVEGDVLVMLEGRDDVSEAVLACGGRPHPWHRTALGGRPAAPWPDPGPFAAATLRLPKAKDELEMTVHAAAASLRPGGRLWVYGTNDEGAGASESRIRQVTGSSSTIASGGRCRVVEAVRPERWPGSRDALEAWQHTWPLDIACLPEMWISYPGVFAHGRVDAGTRALMDTIPPLSAGARVLDFACGSGLLGACVSAIEPSVSVDFLDVDTVALAAVAANLPGVRRILSDGFAGLRGERYDLILSNPPYHEGKDQTGRVLEELASDAPAHLTGKGILLLVTQRRLPVRIHLEEAFDTVEVVLDEGPYRVWRATR